MTLFWRSKFDGFRDLNVWPYAYLTMLSLSMLWTFTKLSKGAIMISVVLFDVSKIKWRAHHRSTFILQVKPIIAYTFENMNRVKNKEKGPRTIKGWRYWVSSFPGLIKKDVAFLLIALLSVMTAITCRPISSRPRIVFLMIENRTSLTLCKNGVRGQRPWILKIYCLPWMQRQ